MATPIEFFSKEHGLKKENYGAYLPFSADSPRLVLTPELSWNPTSVSNAVKPPIVTINGREIGCYKILYKEQTSNVWKTAPSPRRKRNAFI